MSFVVIFLIVIGVVLATPLVLLARRRSARSGASPVEFVTYLILVVATVLTTNAVSSLLEMVMPGDGVLVNLPDNLALTLATLIVAGTVWLAVWIALERQTTAAARPGRGLYISLSTAAVMTVTAVALIRLLLGVFQIDEGSSAALADLAAFGACWILLAYLRRPVDELDEIRVLWGSGLGLTLAIIGTSFILVSSLSAIVETSRILVGSGEFRDGLLTGLAFLLVGVPYLVWFWFQRLALEASPWRSFYAAVVSGLAWFTAVSATASLLFVVIASVLELGGGGGGSRLSAIPGLATAVIVGGLTYWHHRSILGGERTEVVRILEYVFGAAGLIGVAGSVVALVAITIDNLTAGTLVSDFGRGILGSLVSLLVSGVAAFRYWGRALQLGSERAEQLSPARRVTILVLLFGSAVVGAGALIAVLFTLLRAALASDTSELADGLALGIPIVAVAAALCWHLVGIRRADAPKAGPRDAESSLGQTVLAKIVTVVAAEVGPLPELIEGMRFLRRSDGVGVIDSARAHEIVAALAEIEARSVLVTVNADTYEVVPLA